jgi:hypothetical protein
VCHLVHIIGEEAGVPSDFRLLFSHAAKPVPQKKKGACPHLSGGRPPSLHILKKRLPIALAGEVLLGVSAFQELPNVFVFG